MSHIFEALLRSEAERSGVEVPPPTESAVDLLQSRERGTRRETVTAEMFSTAPVLHPAPAVEVERPGVEVPPPVESVVDLLQSGEQAGHETVMAEMFAAAPVLRPAPAVNAKLVCLTDQGSLGAEKFRVLGLHLRHLQEKRKLRRIVVTSSIPEEGKSVIAPNLALNLARSIRLKTLLVDGDLRRPTQATRFGFHRNLPGLSECLRGEYKLTDVVYKLESARLWFLPAGLPPENPIELMQSGHLSEILEHLGAFFDWIIIDSPPIFPLADTQLWMKLADGVLMVTREGISEKKTLGRAVEVIDPSNLVGVVVNSCSGGSQKYYYSRYSANAVNSRETSPSAES